MYLYYGRISDLFNGIRLHMDVYVYNLHISTYIYIICIRIRTFGIFGIVDYSHHTAVLI